MSTNNTYDITIVGGGMVGLSTLVALKPLIESGAKVAVIDPASAPSTVGLSSPSFDDRATALSLASAQFLKQIGIWSLIEPFAQPILDIEVSSFSQIGFTQLSHKQAQTQAFGFIVSNKHIGQALQHFCNQLPSHVDYIYDQHVLSIKKTHNSDFVYESVLSNNKVFKSRLTLLTDGGRSDLKQSLKFNDQVFNYDRVAVVSNVQTQSPHLGKAFERFDQQGPIALLPFHQSNLNALVWTMPTNALEPFLALDNNAKLARLNNRFASRLGYINKLGNLNHYPLKLTMCKEQVRPGLVLLGNSACTLHPVAGQGFNLALFAVKELTQRLNQQTIKRINHLPMLMDYQQSVWPRQQIMSQLSHQMVQTFESNQPVIQKGRSFLLSALEFSPTAKGLFSRFAMGL